MGFSSSNEVSNKIFQYSNYILIGAASSCIFLTLSLRLIPSLCGFFLIFLHIITIAGAIFGCAGASSASPSAAGRWYAAHMVATVLTAIFQGSVSVLIFTRTGEFLGNLKTYVREDDGEVILKMAGGLCASIFCLEWVVLTFAFLIKYNCQQPNNIGTKNTRMVQDQEMKDWPWPFQV